MAITVEAVYEDGELKVKEPLPFKEHEKVQLTVLSDSAVDRRLKAAERGYGLVQWTGDPESLRQLIEDDEYGISEAR